MATNQNIIFLTVTHVKGEALSTPEVRPFLADKIQDMNVKSGIGLDIRVEREEYTVAETAMQIEALKDLANTSIDLVPERALGGSAAGSTQGAGLALALYFNEVTTATDTSAEACDLPAATVGLLRVLRNSHATVALEVFPASGEKIGSLAADAQYDLPAGARVTFYCETAGEWVVCTDNN